MDSVFISFFLDRINRINQDYFFLFFSFLKKLKKLNPTLSEKIPLQDGHVHTMSRLLTKQVRIILHNFIRRRKLEFPGFLQESLEKNPENPVNPVKIFILR